MPISNQESGIKPGTVAHFAAASAPVGWVKANGAAVSRATYAALFIAIGTTYGAGDGSTTFNLPDLRGEFMRGLDDGRGVDSARALGSVQAGMSQINSGVLIGSSAFGVSDGNYDWNSGSSIVGTYDFHFAPYGNSSTLYPETRPRNVALLACIKY